jgi:predicted protein tyrosine phosphatase
MKYIFVCNYARNRSPTAVEVCNEISKLRSLNISAEAKALFPEESEEYEKKQREIFQSSDRIFVMTEEMKSMIKLRYSVPESKIEVLDIEDEYDCYGIAGAQMKKMLRDVLFGKLEELIRKN